jgi:hypothetical protein
MLIVFLSAPLNPAMEPSSCFSHVDQRPKAGASKHARVFSRLIH